MRSRRRRVAARLVRMIDDDRSFDLDFWQEAGPDAIFSAAWEMVQETQAIRGKNGGQSRLQRSVAVLKRIKD